MLTDPSLEPSQQDGANDGHSKKKGRYIPKLSMIPFLILGTVKGQGFNAIPNQDTRYQNLSSFSFNLWIVSSAVFQENVKVLS